jgi:hypothetical protein
MQKAQEIGQGLGSVFNMYAEARDMAGGKTPHFPAAHASAATHLGLGIGAFRAFSGWKLGVPAQ